ncbi:hypothetical protein E2320_021698 [Naja naja]|nr:hypothetical protein E2320_021698 [Naja naja]
MLRSPAWRSLSKPRWKSTRWNETLIVKPGKALHTLRRRKVGLIVSKVLFESRKGLIGSSVTHPVPVLRRTIFTKGKKTTEKA